MTTSEHTDALHRVDIKARSIRPFDFRTYHIYLNQEADTKYQHVLTLAELIIKEDSATWPVEEEWKRRMPDWALKGTRSVTREEADNLLAAIPREQWGQLPWDFGSWLDALKVRGWIWLNHHRDGAKLTIFLGIIESPAHLEAFEELVRVAGATVNSSG